MNLVGHRAGVLLLVLVYVLLLLPPVIYYYPVAYEKDQRSYTHVLPYILCDYRYRKGPHNFPIVELIPPSSVLLVSTSAKSIGISPPLTLYSYVIEHMDIKDLHVLPPAKQRHIMQALANLAKYNGVYEQWNRLRRQHQLKWSSTKHT